NIGLLQSHQEWLTRENVGQVLFQLKPIEERTYTTDELIRMMREHTARISGPTYVEFYKVSGGPPVGKPISVKVEGRYLEEIKTASLAVQDFLKTIPGTHSIGDDFPPGKDEIRILVDDDKAAMYGFNNQLVALNVRYAFDGLKVTEYREADDEVDVVVKYDQANRTRLDDVLNLRITNPAGNTVALREMVRFEVTTGPDEIKRFDQQRTIIVGGEIDESLTSMDKVNNGLLAAFPDLERRFPGIKFKIGGQFEEFMNIFQNIGALFVLSLILIFLILGTQFNSYSQPIIILTTVPFALIGAMLGLVVSGNPFSVIAMYGFVALAGIVVNDAIVMIHFVNEERKSGEISSTMRWRSIIQGGRLRLRPIILTSLTTISGLLPMAFGIGGMSEMWSPLANVILFGLMVSTLLTIFAIPSFIAVVDDIRHRTKKTINFAGSN
ncbi:MAG: efflux RND transporter permease subunit, partial [Calditrichales bacterium]